MIAPTKHAASLGQQTHASYINAYREMWDDDDQNDTEEVAP
jgi:hypothetical protein